MGMDAHIDWSALEALRSAPSATWRAAIQRNLAKGLIAASGAKKLHHFFTSHQWVIRHGRIGSYIFQTVPRREMS
ncbi:hypothetical protein MIZ03_2201 [Rhodoferax lithotrophicus]|uniref:Uncharacterized protein n=1 Tax=Rhodoferax lithotrophicus TaxID=2798804 RepID=A0ABM7MM37_9BURK|nr:hypothetical protein MIZ03_2201 [Rhodoferax sp. MIZ03]